MTPLVPGVVAPIAEYHLVRRRAVHPSAFLAECLLGRSFPELVSLLDIVLRGRVIGVRFEDVAAGFGGRGCVGR